MRGLHLHFRAHSSRGMNEWVSSAMLNHPLHPLLTFFFALSMSVLHHLLVECTTSGARHLLAAAKFRNSASRERTRHKLEVVVRPTEHAHLRRYFTTPFYFR